MIWPLIIAVLLASLLGSLHCAGMCGAFVALAVEDRTSWQRHVSLQAAYHGGRLASYVILGVAAGLAGHLLNLGGALAGIRSAATVIAGATILLFAVMTLARHAGFRGIGNAAPAWLTRLGSRFIRLGMKSPPIARALLIGLSTTLLPCGWLYAFVVTAAGTANPFTAAITMFAFWLGTLPVLITLSAGLRRIIGRRGPVITCLILAIVGLYTMAGRAALDPRVLAQSLTHQTSVPTPGTAPCCKTK